jgi:hypothetical protein
MDDLITPHDFVEDCDCHQCALHARNQLRKALAGISEEMGLPETMGPAKGDLKRLLDNGKAAIDALRDAPMAISAEADFEALTWTFQVAPDCRIGAGKYALVRMGPNAELRPTCAASSRKVAP